MAIQRKIGIIGASASGLYVALLLAAKRPEYRITLLDQMDRAGKKILATGNGHCNLMHVPFSADAFNHPEFVASLLDAHPQGDLMGVLESLGIPTLQKGELIYPLSYSASAHLNHLLGLARRRGIELRLGEKVKAIRSADVETDKNSYRFEALVFAFGGKSQPNLGSDGSMFGLLKGQGYAIKELVPSLCPLRTPDVPKSLFGVRHGALVRLLKGKETLYQEQGEVLFRKDGLSGIAIMNASSKLIPGAEISIDLLPDFSHEELKRMLASSYQNNQADLLVPFFEKPLAEYLLKKAAFNENNLQIAEILSKLIKDLRFKNLEPYGFQDSQVTRGGVSLEDVDSRLRSRLDPNHYFVGECLDIDGLCGGYNLGFALLSALTVVDGL